MANVVEFELDGHAPQSPCFANEDFDKADKAMDYVKNRFLEEKSGTLLVKGGPGTRKTTFLCQAALHLSSKSEKVVCIMNNNLWHRFKEELAEEKTRQELSKDYGGNIVVVGVNQNQESLKKTTKGEELIGSDTIVIIDMINTISHVLFKKLFHTNRMIASVDVSFKFTPGTFKFLVQNSEPSDKLLLLTSSNRSELFLQWPKIYLHNGQINGSETPKGAYMKFHDCREAWADFMAKIVDVVNTLRAEDPEGAIGISADNDKEVCSMKRDLRAAGLAAYRNITVTTIFRWQFMTPVKHFIYFQRTCCNLGSPTFELRRRVKHMNVGVTRPTESFHFIGNLETLSKNRDLQFKAFLQWVRGQEMNTTVLPRMTLLELVNLNRAPEAAPKAEQPSNASRTPTPEARQPSPPPQTSAVNRLLNLVPAPRAPMAPRVAPEAQPPPAPSPESQGAPRARQENRLLSLQPQPAPAAPRRAPDAAQNEASPQPSSVNRLLNLRPAPKAP